MKCKFCGLEMNPIEMDYSKGWECPKCKHEELDHASAVPTTDIEQFKFYLNWECRCINCVIKRSLEEEHILGNDTEDKKYTR